MLEVEIYIKPKKTVSDPQGQTIKHALDSLGFENLEEVRMGKLITIKINTNDKEKVSKDIESMCQKLLANTIIEDYSFQIKES